MDTTSPVPPAGGPDSPAARWIAMIEAGRCTCPGCPGELAPPDQDPYGFGHPRCRVCICAHWVAVIFSDRYACWIPDWTGRCAHAERKRRAELAERRRQELRRRQAEDRDDRH